MLMLTQDGSAPGFRMSSVKVALSLDENHWESSSVPHTASVSQSVRAVALRADGRHSPCGTDPKINLRWRILKGRLVRKTRGYFTLKKRLVQILEMYRVHHT